uniref:Thioredoxin domain-containing protein n=1 Tax=uncultured bacterium Csd4 TaxID=1637487 RepID=A0A0F6WGC8_9BACT|nr:hypothetical protein [uncultured bacterium Csd4]
MRKFTLLTLVTLLFSVTMMAQNKQRVLSPARMASLVPNAKTEAKSAPSPKTLQKQVDLQRLKSAREVFAARTNGKKTTPDKPVMNRAQKAFTAGAPYIIEQPEGTQVFYEKSGQAYYVYIFYVVNTSYTGAVGNVVFGANNEVYIKNIISQLNTGSWVKGTLNGSTITVDFPFKAFEADGDEYFVVPMTFDAEDQWYYPAENTSITFNYDATTGAISTPQDSPQATGETIIGLVDADGSWTGYADWDIEMTKVTDEPIVAPDNIETAQYSLMAPDYEGSLCSVGFIGDDVYIQGLYPGLPDAWVKGTIQGDKVVFKSGQYLGPDEEAGYHEYLMSATVQKEWDDYYQEYYDVYNLSDEDIVFDYDAATKSLSNSSTFLINAGKEEAYYISAFTGAEIKPFVEVAATPATPEWYQIYEGGYAYYSYGYGWGYLYFNIPSSDVDGNFIVTDKLSYAIWIKVNGVEKQLVLSPDDYINLDQAMTEIPFNFTENWDIEMEGSARYLYYYVLGPEAFGIQTIYRGGGEEHRSEIAWMNVQDLGSEIQPDAATPAYPDVDPADVGASINYGYYQGHEDVGMFGEAKPQTYDVAIHIQDPALVGTHIESVTIPVMDAEGLTNIKAWLSSQLRVEGDKNKPDLAEVNVTPAEAGFVTVKFDKPYTIPEEGVYVGYSFDVDEVTNAETAYPVAVISQSTPGGFYMHTSRGFLKWFDLTSMLGANAVMQVSVSGSKVQENAVAPLAGESIFVMANSGEDVEINVDVENHGSAGIKSLDMEYAVAGKTGTQHFDLDEPLDGFFGKKYTATLKVPEFTERGNYTLDVKVTKVNGVENQDAAPQASTPIVALNTVPKHRTLLEEYTGTWCGYCPRGYVALETLAALYPDDYVLISYHNGDPMEIMAVEQFPSVVEGFPDAWIDRSIEVDPYYGTGNDEMGVVKDLTERAKLFGEADIQVGAELSESGVSVKVTTEVTFPYDVTDGNYALEYVLLEDGLTGDPGTDWDQSNYYAGGELGDLPFFAEAESSVPGLVFNDVAVLKSVIGGIDGSIPANVEADKPVTHKYTFYLFDARNTSGEKVIQNANNLKVAVLLINQATGEVVNANKVKVGENTGINAIQNNDSKMVKVEYYDLSGRKLSSLQRGANIVVIRYADGSQHAMKVVK